jgi:hypothetical protein
MAWMGFEQAEFATGLASVLLIVCVRACVNVSEIERGRWRDKGRETESQGAEVGGGRESPRTCIRTHTRKLSVETAYTTLSSTQANYCLVERWGGI